jgi:two-component system response regulator FixJ
LLAGSPDKTVAHDVKISAWTVEVHRANLVIKMGARSLLDLMRIAIMVDELTSD